MGAAVLFGFCSVFGWNTGQIIWDTKIDPDKRNIAPKKKKKSDDNPLDVE